MLDKDLLLAEWNQWLDGIRQKYHLNPKNDTMIKKLMPNMYELFDKIKKGEIKI